jgi:hypothetical protein
MRQWLLAVAAVVFALILVAFLFVLLASAGSYLWEAHGYVALAAVGASLLIGVWVVRRRSRETVPPEHLAAPHVGITMHAIPIAGSAGLLFAVSYIVMFWLGAPPYRPLVLGGAAGGGLLALALIVVRERKRPSRDDASILHLGRGVRDETADSPRGELRRASLQPVSCN